MATQKGKRTLKRLASGAPGNPTAIPTVTNAPAGGTGATAGAYDSAVNRDAMIACVNAMANQLRAIGVIK